MNDLNEIYQELGEHICLYPFFGAFYQTNNVIPIHMEKMPNSVRPCSIVMSDDREKWDITSGSIQQARNNEIWKKMRQDFIDGRFHEIHDCRSCSYNEKSGTTSPRQMNNKFYSEFLSFDIVKEVKSILANNNQVQDIITLDYYPSNYCNYSCIMCAGGASSQRQVFEVKVLGRQEKIVLNDANDDFYQVLDRVEVINFTGGETVLQKQVFEIMDHLIANGRSKDILITLLTNASSSPEKLIDRFEKFKGVIYNVSVDGIGDVIEYQRRGCDWPTVDENCRILMTHPKIVSVINYVLTAVNVFTAMEFIDWAYENNYVRQSEYDTKGYLTISPVFRVDHLGQAALPPELRNIALSRLRSGREKYAAITGVKEQYIVEIIDRFINIIESTPYRPEFLPLFIEHIKKEDSVSKKKLVEVVPEWAPYFN